MESLRLQERRTLSPVKLKKARLNAQITNVTKLARDIGIDRSAYVKWENPERGPLAYVDFVGLTNAMRLFGVTYEDITDPLPTPAQAPA